MSELITPDQMAERMVALVNEHAQGDPEKTVAIVEYLSALLFQ